MSTLQLASDTLAVSPAAGQVEYNGQFYATDSNASRAQVERITQGTAVASTSGTAITFTGIPSWAKRITVILSGVSTSGTNNYIVQLGSGSATTSGYLGNVGNRAQETAFNTGFMLSPTNAAAQIANSVITIVNLSGNIWVESSIMGYNASSNSPAFGSGQISLSGTLDRVIITTVGSTDTFDAGSINIMYEG